MTLQVGKLPAIIIDLDGVIFDFSHRIHYITEQDDKKKDWDAFHDACDADTPIPIWVNLLFAYWDSYSSIPLFVTSRSDVGKSKTEESLLKTFGTPFMRHAKLFMRAQGDHRKSPEVKEEIYKTLIEPVYHVEFALDDWVVITQLWEKLGIPSLTVNSILKDQAAYAAIKGK